MIEEDEFVIMWSINEWDCPWIRVALPMHWTNPFAWICSMYSVEAEDDVRRFTLEPVKMNESWPMDKRSRRSLSRCVRKLFWWSLFDRWGGGVGDLYTVENKVFFPSILTSIVNDSKVFAMNVESSFICLNSRSSRIKKPTPPPRFTFLWVWMNVNFGMLMRSGWGMNQVSCRASTVRDGFEWVMSWISSFREAILLCRLCTLRLAAMLTLRSWISDTRDVQS